jgi:hypothetical protein
MVTDAEGLLLAQDKAVPLTVLHWAREPVPMLPDPAR